MATEERVDAVLIAGDLFDAPRPANKTVIAVRETVRRLVELEIPVLAVPGNHDAHALNPDLYTTALDGAVTFLEHRFAEPVRVECDAGDLFVYGIAYDAAEEPDPLATFRHAQGEGLHVVILHGSVPGAPHWNQGSSLSLPLDALARLDVDYLALGDLHRFRTSDELGGIPACYPGSFAAVDLTEMGLRGPVVVEARPGEPPDIRRLSSGLREVAAPIAVDVSACATDLDVVDKVARHARVDAIPSVVLRGEPVYPLDPEAVRANLEERFGAATVRDESHFFDLLRLEELARSNTVAGHVARLGLETIAGASDEERRSLEQGLRIALRVLEIG